MPDDTAPDERFDTIRLDARRAVRTDEGFLRIPARITRTGIFEYHRQGRVVRELRRPEQVFAPESMASLAGVPITVGHSRRFVTAADTGTHAVGFVGHDVRSVDDRYVEATLNVWRHDAVEAVESGKLVEISAGYRARSGPGGEYRGQRYDVEQVGIRYNHAAMLPPGHARGGPDLAIRLDNHDLITLLRARLGALDLDDDAIAAGLGYPDAAGVRMLLDGHLGTPDVAVLTRAAGMLQMPLEDLLSLAPAPAAPTPPLKTPRVSKMKRSLIVHGVAFPVEIADEMVGSFDAAVAAEDKIRTDAADDASKLAEVEAERDALKTRLDALEAAAEADKLDAVRALAKTVHPKVAGETVRDVQISTLQHLGHGDDVRTDASDDEIAGLFKLAVKAGKPTTPAAPAPAPTAYSGEARTDANDDPAAKAAEARKRMIERGRNAWRAEKS